MKSLDTQVAENAFMAAGDYLNAGGYGFWCGRACAEKKAAEGKPQLFSKKKSKADLAASEAAINRSIADSLVTPSKGLSTGAIVGIAVGGVALLSLIVIAIVKSRK